MYVKHVDFAFPPKILTKFGNCHKKDEHGRLTVNPNVFYPTHGGTFKPAMTMCSDCPVWKECAEWAIKRNEFGCWGGTTEDDRKDIRKHREGGNSTPEPWPEGLKHGHMKKSVRAHHRLGELPCEICHKAWTSHYPNLIINLKSKNSETRNEHDD